MAKSKKKPLSDDDLIELARKSHRLMSEAFKNVPGNQDMLICAHSATLYDEMIVEYTSAQLRRAVRKIKLQTSPA